MSEPLTVAPAASSEGLARRLGPFDATMIVMGGIIGAGIFTNPSVVARQLRSPGYMMAAWGIGGLIALIGAFVYAELAALKPEVGGQYAYLRDAYHPIVAFLYGWTLLLVVQTGGMAAAAIIFGHYFVELSGIAIAPGLIAAITLAVLTIVNCLGVKAGSNVQSALMLTKLLVIAMLVGVGWIMLGPASLASRVVTASVGGHSAADSQAIGLATAMVPVLFAFGGWQTASFVSGEMKNPRRDLPLGLLFGVSGVIVLYLAVSWVCLRALGPAGLAATDTPASGVMRLALGERGARLIALGIAISTVGFLSQSILTAPRVYFAMARDGVFFKAVGWLDPRTQAPVVAIVLQGVWAAAIAFSGRYDRILNYVEAIDVLFFGLTGASLIVFRWRERHGRLAASGDCIRTPAHPVTTLLFVLATWAISVTTVVRYPRDAGIGVGVLAVGAIVYWLWASKNGRVSSRGLEEREGPAA